MKYVLSRKCLVSFLFIFFCKFPVYAKKVTDTGILVKRALTKQNTKGLSGSSCSFERRTEG